MSSTPTREKPEIRLVVFDLGRVLVRICDDWQHACACAGLDVPAFSIAPADQLKLVELSHQHEVAQIDSARFIQESAKLMGLSSEQVRAASASYIVGAYPGTVQLLDELSAMGVATACLTNTNPHHWELLYQAGHPSFFPLDRLKWRFASHLMRLRKPGPAIYKQVEKETGIAPGSILFFDDVAENVDAARHCGWNAVRIDPALDDPMGQVRRALKEFRVIQ